MPKIRVGNEIIQNSSRVGQFELIGRNSGIIDDVYDVLAKDIAKSIDLNCVECPHFLIEKRQETDFFKGDELLALRVSCKAFLRQPLLKLEDVCPDLARENGRIRGKSGNWMIVDELADYTWSDWHNRTDHVADATSYGLQAVRDAKKSRDIPKTNSIEAW